MMREWKIRELMTASHDGMLTVAKDATSSEVFSAYVTMCASSVEAAKLMGTPIEVLRGAVQQILLRLDDPNGRTM